MFYKTIRRRKRHKRQLTDAWRTTFLRPTTLFRRRRQTFTFWQNATGSTFYEAKWKHEKKQMVWINCRNGWPSYGRETWNVLIIWIKKFIRCLGVWVDNNNKESTLFQSRRSVAVPDLIREPDEYTPKSPTLLHTTGSRVKHGMTRCASASIGKRCFHSSLYHRKIEDKPISHTPKTANDPS